jgi:hypothetical protein
VPESANRLQQRNVDAVLLEQEMEQLDLYSIAQHVFPLGVVDLFRYRKNGRKRPY